jgi:hypothetical protein
MIVNIRGTGGSGKSTVIRRIMELYGNSRPVYQSGRKRPYGYELSHTALPHPLYVVGHYETPCGGGDTIANVEDVFDSVRSYASHHDVLFEGIISQDDTKRTIMLAREFPNFLVIFLTTSLKDCLDGIQQRRNARGDMRMLNSRNTESRMKRCNNNHYPRLRDAGIKCLKLGREEAFQECVKALGIPAVADVQSISR